MKRIMSRYTIWHNPRCSKSRQTLELLEGANVEVDVVRYLETPPTEAELKRVLHLLGLEPRDLMRTKEAEYGELGLSDATLSNEALIEAMHTHPKLIERPVVIHNDKAVLGRPPEQVKTLL